MDDQTVTSRGLHALARLLCWPEGPKVMNSGTPGTEPQYRLRSAIDPDAGRQIPKASDIPSCCGAPLIVLAAVQPTTALA